MSAVAEVYPALQEASPGGSFKYYFYEPSEHVSAIADAIDMNQAGASKEIKLTGHNAPETIRYFKSRKRPFVDILAPKGSGSIGFCGSESECQNRLIAGGEGEDAGVVAYLCFCETLYAKYSIS